jgi:hypothetical protein
MVAERETKREREREREREKYGWDEERQELGKMAREPLEDINHC